MVVEVQRKRKVLHIASGIDVVNSEFKNDRFSESTCARYDTTLPGSIKRLERKLTSKVYSSSIPSNLPIVLERFGDQSSPKIIRASTVHHPGYNRLRGTSLGFTL